MTGPDAILLINPDWTGIKRQKQFQFKRIWQPLDLATAAAMVEKDGFSVEILDNNIQHLSPHAVGRKAAQFDKVFVTSTPYDRWQCPALDIQFVFDTIQEIPRDRLYLMGAHVTERPEAILKKSRARLGILGEPERTILELVRQDHAKEIPEHIPGIAFMRGNRLIRTKRRACMGDMNSLPYPAYHLLPMAHYYYEVMGRNFAILEASRGCPHGCNFCYLGMHDNRFRQKRLDRLMQEVAYVRDRFNVENVYFMDLEFALNRSFVRSFCEEMIRRDMQISWCCQTRVTDVDKELLGWMKQAGCNLIHFGVESGSPNILSRTGKGITIDDCVHAVSMVHASGIRTALFMNFGFPGETHADMKATIGLALQLDPTYASFHLIVPFPGTRLAEAVGLDAESLPAHLYPHYNSAHHDLKSLKAMLLRAYLRFYLRPSYLMRMLNGHVLPKVDYGRLFLRWLKG